MANPMVQADLMTVRAKRLLVALPGITFFILGDHFQVLAKLPGKTQDLVLGVCALPQNGGGVDELICAFARRH